MLPAVVAGLATGTLLGAVGAGGAILLVPVLVIGFGLDIHQATGTALAVVFATATFGAGLHARQGHVRLREAALVGLPGMAAAVAFAPLNARLPSQAIAATLVVVLVVVLVAVAARMWRPVTVVARRRGTPLALATGVGAGALTGLLGVGGGFVLVPALVLVLGLPVTYAVGTSLVIIAANSGSALAGYWVRGDVALGLGLILASGSIAGVLGGSGIPRLVGERRLQQGFAALLVLVAGLMAAREVAAQLQI